MSADYDEATDEMFALVAAGWQASLSIVTPIPELRWPADTSAIPDPSQYWARVSRQTVLERQATFRNGVKRYVTSGLIFVQVFAPVSEANGWEKGSKLAKLARNIFRGAETSSSVWFRNARINELTADRGAHRFNVVAEFEYDELS